MSIFEQDKRKLYRHELSKFETKEELLDELFGNCSNDYYSDYDVYIYTCDKKTIWNRLNLLWFVPLWLLTIPFQWLIRGRVGVNTNSKLGRLIHWLVRIK